MRSTRNTLAAAVRGKSVILLGTGLIHAIDLERQAKQAHWNVEDTNFLALHKLFDEIATAASGFADSLAERSVALGGTADGRIATVTNRSTLPAYPLDARSGVAHLNQLAASLATFGTLARAGIEDSAEWRDLDTSEIFTQISTVLDQKLWLIEAHTPPTD
jgi:starvation-inducible DNA-binding protein